MCSAAVATMWRSQGVAVGPVKESGAQGDFRRDGQHLDVNQRGAQPLVGRERGRDLPKGQMAGQFGEGNVRRGEFSGFGVFEQRQNHPRETVGVPLRPVEDVGVEQVFHFVGRFHPASSKAGLAGS